MTDSLIGKILVSFLLANTGVEQKYAYSFTNDVIREKKSSNLESSIKQLCSYQHKLQIRFQQLLLNMIREKYPHRLQEIGDSDSPVSIGSSV